MTVSPTSASLDVGQSITFTASVSVSSTNYEYQWYLNGNPVGTNSSSYEFYAPNSGTFTIYVTVTQGGIVESSNDVVVTVYSVPTVTITPSISNVHVGQTVNLVASVTGGTGQFTYLWYLNGTKTTETSSSYPFTPQGNATYYFYVLVNDTGAIGQPSISVKSNNAQVIAFFPTYPVAFAENGLPEGIEWYVNLSNGQSHPVIGNINLFYETNGTYTYTVASSNKVYAPAPAYGVFIVNGGTVTVDISFYPVLYHVYFNESNSSQLPRGAAWYVNISGQPSFRTTSSSIEANISNGTYNVTFATGDKEYYPTPYYASLRINGHSSTMVVTFSLFTYNVQFSEIGLPLNTMWFVKVIGISTTNITASINSSSQSILFTLPNGSYSYRVFSAVQTYGPFPSNGSFNVTGAPVSLSVRFLRLYLVSFYESGLPVTYPGIRWYVNITGSSSYYSSNRSLTFWEPNGTWHYSISTNDKWFILSKGEESGDFYISGSSVSPYPDTSPVIFNEIFNVTFNQSKLPGGIRWYVNLSNGESFSSVSNEIRFTETNGTYNYSISTVNKIYRPSPYSSSFIIDGISRSLQVIFYIVTYPVTFTETGLVNGTLWSIMINNLTRISTNSTITFRLYNGTFQYSIQPLSGFSTNQYNGNISLNGYSVTETIAWKMITYYLNITQTGLKQGNLWSATVEGKTFYGATIKENLNSTGSSISFLVPNGTYNYTVNPPLGFSGNNLSGTSVIRGNSTVIDVTIIPPNYVLIGISSGLAAAGIALSIGFMIRRERRSILMRRDPFSGNLRELKSKK
ncbi:MAG: hypothetical protein QXN66_01355 [Thermoplasmatales archaeon]